MRSKTVLVRVNDAIDEIAADEWNSLVGSDFPFLRHEFLLAAEHSGSVSPETGWIPRHLTCYDDSNKLRAALVLYEKSHSWGEFVFDWAWANAYEQAGYDYYPKLVAAVPFTPAPGKRLLLRDPADTEAASALLGAAIRLAEDTDCSSVHILFPDADDLPLLQDQYLSTSLPLQSLEH